VIVGGGVVGVGTATLYNYRLRAARMEAMMQVEQVQMEAVRAQEALEQGRKQAQRAEEQAKRRQAEQDAK